MSLPYWLAVAASVALGAFGVFVIAYDRKHGAPVLSPGWYLDPEGSGQNRQWDGSAWGDQLVPRPISVFTGARIVALGILIAVAILVLLSR